ncbi:hypothetical protein EBZ38_03500 [bacterium]|nr:hypothetical protein [bacterium]NDC94027.1 hypothetical protein [bacterium]NDD83332.1 hypothetical protein [bacterium]
MAFIRNTDKLIEGSSKLFFSNVRAKAAVQSDLDSLSSRISSEQSARQSEDNGIKLRLGVIEGGAGVVGSIAKAQADAQAYADQKVAALVNSAPAVLDTLKELSDAIGGDASFASTVAGQIGAVDDKVDQEIFDRQSAISLLQSSFNSDVSDLEAAISAEESRAMFAEGALDGRLDLLEADPVTKSYVDGEISSVEGQVSAEQSRAMTAEGLLDGRLDVLEQDPTTKAYVDSEVSDLQGQLTQEISDRQGAVSAEEARAMAAEGLLDGRLDALELDPVTKTYVDGIQSSLDGRLDVLESDPVTKTYVDGEVSDLQSQVNTEKGRINAILSASQADKDSFAEIVSLINSVDTSNDSAFAGYVSSNNAAVSALEAQDLTLVKLDGSRSMTGGLNITSSVGNDRQVRLQANNNGGQLASGDYIGEYRFQVLQSNLSTYTSTIKIQGQAIESHSASALGSVLNFEVTPAGATARQVVMSMFGDKVEIKKPMEVPVDWSLSRPADGLNSRGYAKMSFADFTDPSSNNQTQIKFDVRRNSSDSSERLPLTLQADHAILGRGLAYRVIRKSASYTVANSEPIQVAQATGITYTLPSAPVQGQMHTFKDATGSCSSGAPITIQTNPNVLGSTIDGSGSYQLTAPYEAVSMVWDSTIQMWLVM